MSLWQAGAEHELEITGLNHAGAGVGRIDGRVVFVPDSLPGERVRIRITETKKRYGTGTLLQVLDAAPERIEPTCPHAQFCGGCQFQHLDYEAQLKWKGLSVQDALERIGGLDLSVKPTVGMARPYEYRNNTQHAVGKQAGHMVMGFFRKGSHDIVDVSTCELQHPLATQLALNLKDLVRVLNIEPYDRKGHTGVLRHAVIRVSFAVEELMLVLVTRTPELPNQAELIERLTDEIPQLVSIAHNVNPRPGSTVMGRETKVIWGKPYLVESIGDLRYAISPASFFQVNSKQTKVLYDLVKAKLPLSGKETVLDLYCGAGTIGLYLAADAGRIIGVETAKSAVLDAEKNAELNRITNAEFRLGRAEDELPRLLQEYKEIDAVILDPPRRGCDPSLLAELIAAEIPRIVYVSCNPATLARDLAILTEGGYSPGTVQPVDMFPWTSHVESVVLMSRVEK